MGAGPLRGQIPLTALGPDDVLSAVPRFRSLEMGGDVWAPYKWPLRMGYHWFFWLIFSGIIK